MRSCEPERAWRPSGLTATALTGPSCPMEIARDWLVTRSQSLTVRSSEPERAWRPSGAIATALTACSWPAKVRRSWPVCRSQSLSVRSSRAREGVAAVGAHRHRAHPVLVACESAKELAGLQVPELERCGRRSRRGRGGRRGSPPPQRPCLRGRRGCEGAGRSAGPRA